MPNSFQYMDHTHQKPKVNKITNAAYATEYGVCGICIKEWF